MAKQPRPATLEAEMERHIHTELGLASVATYRAWCVAHGFPDSVRKSEMQRRHESDFHRRTSAEAALRRARGSHNPSHAIARIFAGELDEGSIVDEPLSIIAQACRKQRASAELRAYLMHLDSVSRLLTDRDHTIAALNLQRFAREWIRPAEEWRPRSHNIERQLSSLARHLLCEYDPPPFMDRVWYGKNRTRQRWFIHIGRGGSIRTAEGLPAPLTKRMAHCFLEAPERYTPLQAIRYGQVLALGGDRRIADAVIATRMAADFHDNDFNLELIRFFVRNPLLDTTHYQPIVDYIWNRKYENQAVFVARGVVENRGPAQPGFSMAGRTPETLLRHVEEWHGRLGRTARGSLLQWAHSPAADFELVEGRRESKTMRIWRIVELVSSSELEEEGRALGHCVATYAASCHRGVSSIWSLRCETEKTSKRLLTVEVNAKSREVVQARGLGNRLPEPKEIEILRRWAAAARLRIATWVDSP
jgi:hypothetical protein